MKLIRNLVGGVLRARGGMLGMLQTAIVQVGMIAVNLLTGSLTARLLGPAGRGELAAALVWFMLPPSIAIAGLQSSVLYQTRRYRSQSGPIGVVGLLLAMLVALPVFSLCFYVLPPFMHAYNQHVLLLADWAMVGSLLNIWMLLLRQSLLGTRNMHLFNVSLAGSPFVYLLLLLAVSALNALTSATALLAQIAATVIVLIPTLVWAARAWSWRRARPLAILSPLLRYGAHAAPIDLAGVFYSNVDRLVMVPLVAPAEFGLYAVASSFARVVYVLQAAVSSVTLADLANRPRTYIEAYIHRTFRVLFWLLLSACIFGIILGKPLLGLIYGSGFEAALPIYRVMLLESAISCVSQVLVEAFLACGRPRYPAVVQTFYAVLLLITMLVLTPMWGGLGAALAMLLAVLCKLMALLSGLPRLALAIPSLLPQRGDIDLLRRMLTEAGKI